MGCGNGLDALTLILRAYMELGMMERGDEGIVPANTYIATILAITECGLVPVLVEPCLDTLELDGRLIDERVTVRTRAVMLVHLYGQCAYTDAIAQVCRHRGLLLIEDNAQAHGCTHEGRRTGSLGDAAGHSFYPGKNLGALGDAGAVTTNDQRLADMVRRLGNYGSETKYVHDHLGRNSRIDELQAAVLDAKLLYLDQANERRRQIAAIYINKVKNPLVTVPQAHADHVYHIFPILTAHRDDLQRFLLEHGVETQIHYPIPPHHQRCYAEWADVKLPITERIHREVLSLPCNQTMTDGEACQVADLLNAFCP